MNVGLKRVKNLYEQSRANVRWGRGKRDCFEVKRGLRQGHVMLM